MSKVRWLFMVVLLTACAQSTEPSPWGPLQTRFTEGRRQEIVAGMNAGTVLSLSYREPRPVGEALWKRVLLPRVAYAQSTTYQVQPGAVVCIREDQQDIVPKTRCVTADALGNARFDWLRVTTRAGTYTVVGSSTYGLEATREDTVYVTVLAGPPNPDLHYAGVWRCGESVSDAALTDKYSNPIQFRIVSDGRIGIADTTYDVKGRTFSCDASMVDTTAQGRPVWYGPLEVRSSTGLVARALYGIKMYQGAPLVEWHVFGLNMTPVL